MSNMSRMDQDYYAWAVEQAALLRDGRLVEADIDNIAEELLDLGRAEKRALESRLGLLLAHLLKWEKQPGLRSTSWQLTIKEQRRRLERILTSNPSLRSTLEQTIDDAYGDALLIAQRETGLAEAQFPLACPYATSRIFDPDFMPE